MNSLNGADIPKGWQRKEVVRKSGQHKGKIDIYVISPRGKTFRSKKELSNYITKNKLDWKIKDFNFSTKKLILVPRKRKIMRNSLQNI